MFRGFAVACFSATKPTEDNVSKSAFPVAKSSVAPDKMLGIPKLELPAALFTIAFMKTIKGKHKNEFD